MKNLFKNLEDLRGINPDPDFLHRSKTEILATYQTHSSTSFRISQFKNRLVEGLSFAAALGLTSLLLYLTISGLSGSSSTVITQQDKTQFDIQLRDAKYYKEVAPNVYVVVLNENMEEEEFQEELNKLLGK
jgi:uncharacterized Fe-S cluster-containing radical SAM superfamily protein